MNTNTFDPAEHPRHGDGKFARKPHAETDVALVAAAADDDLVTRLTGDEPPEALVDAVKASLGASDASTWDLHDESVLTVEIALETAPDRVFADAVREFRKTPVPPDADTAWVQGTLAECVKDVVYDETVESWRRYGRDPDWSR